MAKLVENFIAEEKEFAKIWYACSDDYADI